MSTTKKKKKSKTVAKSVVAKRSNTGDLVGQEPSKRLPKGEKVLCLRTVDVNRKAYGGFQWPAKGMVIAPDWNPIAECGQGLHGLLLGEGDANHLSKNKDALSQVVEVLKSEVVDLKGKVKFPRCEVLYTGSQGEAVKRIQEAFPSAACAYGQATAGNYGQATAGYNGKATAGDSGQATAGYNGQATAGETGILELSYTDTVKNRRRIVIGYIGEDGLKPGVTYKLDATSHTFVEVPNG